MPIDIALSALASEIESGQPWPRPQCPTCLAGHIRFAPPSEEESPESARGRGHPAFETYWVRGTFLARGECENPGCKQVFHCTGDFTTSDSILSTPGDDGYNDYPQSWSSYYEVKNIHPPLMLMAIPKSAPPPVREGIERAARVLFADPGLATTALRSAVERFLTASEVASTTSNGSFRPVHARIDEWRHQAPGRDKIADLLTAVKWLGNAGTHETSDLTISDVLGGAALLDEAFHRLFLGPDIEAAAQTINDTRGPIRTVEVRPLP